MLGVSWTFRKSGVGVATVPMVVSSQVSSQVFIYLFIRLLGPSRTSTARVSVAFSTPPQYQYNYSGDIMRHQENALKTSGVQHDA